MPFKETCRMEERIRMLSDYDTGNWSISDLCRRYGISRDTFYEWRKRRESRAAEWFMERSHAPLHCPHRTEAAISEAVISFAPAFPAFGTAQAAGGAGAPGSRDLLAGGFDDRRYPQAGRADYAGEAASDGARRAAVGDGGGEAKEAAGGRGDTVADMANGWSMNYPQFPETVTLALKMGSEFSNTCWASTCVNPTRPDRVTDRKRP